MEYCEPFNIDYFTSGGIASIEWRDDPDHRYNKAKAEYIEFYNNGKVRTEEWFLDGRPHKRDAPATIGWFENGNIMFECWFLFGERHRLDGPAIIVYDINGNVERTSWCLDGQGFNGIGDWAERNAGLPKAEAVELKMIYG